MIELSSPFFFPSFPAFFSLILPGLVSFSENLNPDASMKLPEPDAAGDAALLKNERLAQFNSKPAAITMAIDRSDGGFGDIGIKSIPRPMSPFVGIITVQQVSVVLSHSKRASKK